MNTNSQNTSHQTMVIGAITLASLKNADAPANTRNGVKEPGSNDSMRPIWDTFEELREMGAEPTKQTAYRVAAKLNRDANTVLVTYYLWKKFNDETV